MDRNVRTVKIVNRTAFRGLGVWTVSHYLDGSFICNTRRRTRKEAREVARNYIETGMIPLN